MNPFIVSLWVTDIDAKQWRWLWTRTFNHYFKRCGDKSKAERLTERYLDMKERADARQAREER